MSRFVGGSMGAHATDRPGDAPGEFCEPMGVALMHELLFVAEFAGKRVQVLTKDGEPLEVVPMPGPCTALCVDAFHVAVCEGGKLDDNGETHRVHLLNLKQPAP
jgi:hypothetical protein